MTAHDLDSPEIRSTLLIEPIDEQDSQRITLMAVSIDSAASNLTFDLVLSPFSPRYSLLIPRIRPLFIYFSSASEPNLRVRFWRVELVGHGVSASLKANHLKSLSMPPPGIFFFSLRDDIYAQSVYTNPPRVEVYDWQKSTSESYISASFTAERKSIVSGLDYTTLSTDVAYVGNAFVTG